MANIIITIYVRHSEDCEFNGDEFTRKCDCRKWFRWQQSGKRIRETAGTRSWAEAESLKRKREDVLNGFAAPTPKATNILDAIDAFVADKRVQGISANVISTYRRELRRLTEFMSGKRVYNVQQLDRVLLTGYMATWPELYPSSVTRSTVRDRLKCFLKYCFDSQWLERVPTLTPIKVESVPTMPLSPDEYARLLAACDARLRPLVELMRWSGLAIRDALRSQPFIVCDPSCRVVIKRQKTGTDVSVPLPTEVASAALAADFSGVREVWHRRMAKAFDAAVARSRYPDPGCLKGAWPR
jgi:integrase/recombinase XerD